MKILKPLVAEIFKLMDENEVVDAIWITIPGGCQRIHFGNPLIKPCLENMEDSKLEQILYRIRLKLGLS